MAIQIEAGNGMNTITFSLQLMNKSKLSGSG
jgi:hypothetical protein